MDNPKSFEQKVLTDLATIAANTANLKQDVDKHEMEIDALKTTTNRWSGAIALLAFGLLVFGALLAQHIWASGKP